MRFSTHGVEEEKKNVEELRRELRRRFLDSGSNSLERACGFWIVQAEVRDLRLLPSANRTDAIRLTGRTCCKDLVANNWSHVLQRPGGRIQPEPSRGRLATMHPWAISYSSRDYYLCHRTFTF